MRSWNLFLHNNQNQMYHKYKEEIILRMYEFEKLSIRIEFGVAAIWNKSTKL
jgi:hypothetical protein